MGLMGLMGGCVRNSGGVWYFHEAKRPPDWPTLTPVGQVQVKEYPAYREALVRSDPAAGNASVAQDRSFGVLFQHIKRNDIAMTAPVDMGMSSGDEPTMRSMSFLYDLPDRGPTGQFDAVTVRDVEPLTVVSIGVRGGYSPARYEQQVARLRAWLNDHAQAWRATGEPRLLGYNSPFVPVWWRYGEVQIPVEPVPAP